MMFFSLYVQQNQWIAVALLTGVALTLTTWLTYGAMWRPREMEREAESRIEIKGPASFLRWVVTVTPWVLILIVIGTTIYTVTHLYMAAQTLPNW